MARQDLGDLGNLSDLDEEELIARARAVDCDSIRIECDIPCSISVNGSNYHVQLVKSSSLNNGDKEALISLLRTNMQKLYEESTWGWKEDEKRAEVQHEDSRFLLITYRSSSVEGVNKSSKELQCDSISSNRRDVINGELKAFSMFRFDWDDDEEPEYPVLYCYELQVDSSCQRCGFGKMLMQALQKIAASYRMRKTMLTCFKFNTPAMAFYRGIGFAVDRNSPSNFGNPDEVYEILSDNPNAK